MIASGAATICEGENATISATGASTYSWDNGLGSGALQTISPTSTTTYEVTGTDANGCENTDQITVNVNTLPNVVASGAATICEGENATISAAGASTYSWDNGLGSGASQSVSPTSTTTYEVTGADANGCENTDQVTINVNPLPSVTLSPLADACVYDETYALSGGMPAGGTFSGNGVSSTNFDPSVAGVGSHTITYTYTDVNGCSAEANQAILVIADCSGVGLEDLTMAGYRIYPNPADEVVYIQRVDEAQDAEINIYDGNGKLIYSTIVKENPLKLTVSDWSSGIYNIQLSVGNQNYHSTLVIK